MRQQCECGSSGRLRLNLNLLNLVCWTNSWPFDKTWKPGLNDSTWANRFNSRAMNLEWIFIMTLNHVQKLLLKASPYVYFLHLYGASTITTGMDLMPFNYFVCFQSIQPKDSHSMNLLGLYIAKIFEWRYYNTFHSRYYNNWRYYRFALRWKLLASQQDDQHRPGTLALLHCFAVHNFVGSWIVMSSCHLATCVVVTVVGTSGRHGAASKIVEKNAHWKRLRKSAKMYTKENFGFCLFSSSPSVATGVVVFVVHLASCASIFGCSATILTIVASNVKSVLEFFVNFCWPRKKTVFTVEFPVLDNIGNTSDYVRADLSRAVSKTFFASGCTGSNVRSRKPWSIKTHSHSKEARFCSSDVALKCFYMFVGAAG